MKPIRTVAVIGTGMCDDPVLPEHVRTVREALAHRLGPAVRLDLQPVDSPGAEGRSGTGPAILSEEETLLPLGGAPRGSLASARMALYDAESDSTSAAPMPIDQYVRRDIRVHERLQKALGILLSLPPSPERSRTLQKARTLALQLYSAMVKKTELEQTLESIFRVEPGFEFDPRIFSPPQIEQYDEVRQRIHARSTATLKVTSRPAGMTIYVDGFEVGPAPITMKVPPGRYRVEAAVAVHRGIAHTVRVDDWAEVEIDGDLEGSLEREGTPCMAEGSPEDRSARLTRLAALLGVDLVVAVRAEQPSSQESYLLVDAIEPVAGQRHNRVSLALVGGRARPGGLDRLWEELGVAGRLAPIDPAAPQIPPLTPLAPASARAPAPSWMRPGAYAAGGLAVGLAGFALFEGLSARSSYSKADALRQPDGTILPADQAAYDVNRRDGNAANTAMYVNAGGALFMAGVAGVLGYLSREPEPLVVRF